MTVACTTTRTPRADVSSSIGPGADSVLSRFAMYGLSGTVLIEEGGRTVLEKGYGLANREQRIEATPTTRYDIGSITKTFTAAAVLELVELGRLRLSDSLGTLFEGVPDDKAGITIHQLLTHTGGFPLDPADAGITPTDSREIYITKALRHPIAGGRIGAYAYSNLGYGLLALIVENKSGRAFRTFVDREFVEPLGLLGTSWWNDSVALRSPGAAVGYVVSDREGTLVAEPPFGRESPTSPMWAKWPLGAAGMISTVRDVRTWWHALRGGRVVRQSLADSMLSRRDSAGNQGYGWTITSVEGLGRRIHRGGSRTGFNSLIAAYPDRNALVVFAVNQSADGHWHTLLWRSLERLLRGARDSLPPPAVTVSRAALGHFEGVYRDSAGGAIRIVADDGALLVGAENQAGVNALLSREVPDEPFGQWSVATVRAALGGGPLLPPVTDAQLAELQRWIEPRLTTGADTGIQLLGSVPHPSSATRVQTFVRVRGTVVRLIWEPNRLLAWGDGIRFPVFRRFLPTSATTAASFAAREGTWTMLERAGPRLVIDTWGRERKVIAERVSP